MKSTSMLLVIAALFSLTGFALTGCDSPKAPILPTTPLTEQQIREIRNEDEKIAFEESQGSMTTANNLSE